MTAAIETIGLSRRFGKTVALAELDLCIAAGAIYGFIGPNGAGKTTTLRLLAGLIEPSAGQIRLMGQPTRRNAAAHQYQVGYMPDFFGVYDDLRAWEYLDFFARCYGLPAARRRSVVDQLLELVDLTPKRNAFVQTLSRGMQQRLCLAHALVHDPPILLLDEPASGLDPRARVELRELLRTLRDMGKTILLSSHILSELAEICTEIGIIESGRMVASGPVGEVHRQLRGRHDLRLRLLREGPRAAEMLRALDPAAAAEKGLPAIQSVSIVAANENYLAVELECSNDEQIAALLVYLVDAGLPLIDFHMQAENLENLFLRITEVR
jgi:ABC-2 type transport system ATP-binding protein